MKQAAPPANALFQPLSPSCDTSPLGKLKNQARERLVALGAPLKTDPGYRYLKLRSFFSHSWVDAPAPQFSGEMPEREHSLLVFVDGHYVPGLSSWKENPKQARVMSLHDAMLEFGTLVRNRWRWCLEREHDRFSLLNRALHPQALFIYLLPDAQLEAPIEVLQICSQNREGALCLPRVHVHCGRGSRATFLFSRDATNVGKECTVRSMDFALEERAHITNVHLLTGSGGEEWHFERITASLREKSCLESTLIAEGSKGTHADYAIFLEGEAATARISGLQATNDRREAHVHVRMEHGAPGCHSFQCFKNVLRDFSRTSFEGKIFVKREAQKTDAFQVNHNLLLSEGVQAHSLPNLEIFADDVKASHGATFGQLDQEQLFYLRSRGLTEQDAARHLLTGYCKEALSLIPDSLREAAGHWETLLGCSAQ